MNKYGKIMERIAPVAPVAGSVGRLATRRRTERGTSVMSVRRLAPTAQLGDVRTPGEKTALGLERRQEKFKGKGVGATTIAGKRTQAHYGIAAGTEMNWKDKLYEALLEGPEGKEAWKDFWKDKETEGDKPKKPMKRTKVSKEEAAKQTKDVLRGRR